MFVPFNNYCKFGEQSKKRNYSYHLPVCRISTFAALKPKGMWDMLMCTYSFRSSDRPWKAPGVMVLIKLCLRSLGRENISGQWQNACRDDVDTSSIRCSAHCKHVCLEWAVCLACGETGCSFLTVKVTCSNRAAVSKDRLRDSEAAQRAVQLLIQSSVKLE